MTPRGGRREVRERRDRGRSSDAIFFSRVRASATRDDRWIDSSLIHSIHSLARAPGTRSSLAATATPFAWQCDLYADVDPARTTIAIDGTAVTFTCVELESETWPGLRARGDGAAVARRRLAAERESAREDARAETRRDEEKRAVRRAFAEKQWAIDDALERATRVSSSNARERRAAAAGLEDARARASPRRVAGARRHRPCARSSTSPCT